MPVSVSGHGARTLDRLQGDSGSVPPRGGRLRRFARHFRPMTPVYLSSVPATTPAPPHVLNINSIDDKGGLGLY